MKTRVWILSLAGVLLIVMTTMVSAETICVHDLISQNDNYGFSSNIDGDLWADNFEVGSDFLIQSITWYGMYASDGSDVSESFDVKIYNLSSEQLFAALGITSVTKTNSGVTDVYGNIIYAYEAALPSWEIAVGEYLISISNSNSDYSNWFWADGTGGDGKTYYLDSGTWVAESDDVDLAFSLYGESVQTAPVPEPGTILLFGIGLLVTTFYRRPGRHR